MSQRVTGHRTSDDRGAHARRRTPRAGVAAIVVGVLLLGGTGWAAATDAPDIPAPIADSATTDGPVLPETDGTVSVDDGAPSTTVDPGTDPTTAPATDPTTEPETLPAAPDVPTEQPGGAEPRTTTAVAAQAGPSITVNPASGLAASGQDIVVTGRGFNAAANRSVGVYVVFGPKDPQFWLDANAFKSAKWVHPGGPSPESAGQAKMNPDGSFSITLTSVTATYDTVAADGTTPRKVDCAVSGCYVMTFGAHGATDRSQDTFTAVSFGGETSPGTGTGVVPPPTTGTDPGTTTGSGGPAATGDPGAAVAGAGASNSGGSGSTASSSSRSGGASSAGGSAARRSLARTGSDSSVAGAGLTLLALGMLMIAVRRRCYEQLPVRG